MKTFLFSIIGVGASLSLVAAFYSIGGLVKIFKGSDTSIMILGGILELAKILISIFLHVYWDRARKLLVGYLTFALVILAFVTSLGIFGALSSAYFNSTDTEQLQVKISILQSQIEIEQSKIKNDMAQISSIASVPKEEKQAWHFFKINALSKEVDGYTKEIDRLNESLLPLKAELNRMNTEVGPLKYLAGWIYGETENATDKAVQLFIVMLVTVFDPLALLLIFAGIHGFEIERHKQPKQKVEIVSFEIPSSVMYTEQKQESVEPVKEPEPVPVEQEVVMEVAEVEQQPQEVAIEQEEPLEDDDELILFPDEEEHHEKAKPVNSDEQWALNEMLSSSFDSAPPEPEPVVQEQTPPEIIEHKLSKRNTNKLLKMLGKTSDQELTPEDVERLLGLLGKQPHEVIGEEEIKRLQKMLEVPKPKKKKSNVIPFPEPDEREITTYTNNSEFDKQLKNINYIK